MGMTYISKCFLRIFVPILNINVNEQKLPKIIEQKSEMQASLHIYLLLYNLLFTTITILTLLYES